MTDYNEILDTQIDQDSAVTEDLMTQMRDNPIAIAEGSDGAPRVQGVALGGRIFYAKTTTDGNWLTVTDIPRVQVVDFQYTVGIASGDSSTLQIALSDDGGSTWSAKTIVSLSDGANTGNAIVNVVDGEGVYFNTRTSSAGATTNIGGDVSFSGLSGCDAIRVRASGEQGTYMIRIESGVVS